MSCWDEGLPKKYLKTHKACGLYEWICKFDQQRAFLKIYCRELSKTLGFGKIQPLWCHQVYLSLETFLAVSPHSSEAWILKDFYQIRYIPRYWDMISRTHGGRKSEFVTLKDPTQNAHFQLFYFIHNDWVVSFPFHTFRRHFAVLTRCLLLSAAAPSSFPAWPLLK